jgi:DNA ligase-1
MSVEAKLDGARVQVHRLGDEIRVFTRNLNDATERLPDVVAVVAALPVSSVILDGEALALDAAGRPLAFQATMSRFGTGPPVDPAGRRPLVPRFFDVIHLDGEDLIDRPLEHRLRALDSLPGDLLVDRVVTADVATAQRFTERVLAAGHEGVMVKRLDAPYAAGVRGAAWLKVKPVHTLDLVVLAVEWGSGRREGWLSNLHLGARDPDGGFVMLGKTFKGLTDAMLVWQTEHLLGLETSRHGHVVEVRPELVVEIALDGVQASPRYPGGVALRFARVKGYRPDKSPDEADTIETVLAMLP